ncbi:MAG: S4 domain-containing protein, partial [Eubacteriales bacterium]|nr:S4 domain-containing protein [Eubacteriales bacterium]
ITFPLLPGLDGFEKMSKSLDNYIGIDEPAEIMYEKCMKVPDNLLITYFNLTTDLSEDKYLELIGKDIRAAHFLYAETIVRLYHGEDAIAPAAERYRRIAQGGVPENIDEYDAQKGSRITQLLVNAGLAPSTSEARRLIQGGGIKLDGVQVSDVNEVINKYGSYIISKGKNKFAKFNVK